MRTSIKIINSLLNAGNLDEANKMIKRHGTLLESVKAGGDTSYHIVRFGQNKYFGIKSKGKQTVKIGTYKIMPALIELI